MAKQLDHREHFDRVWVPESDDILPVPRFEHDHGVSFTKKNEEPILQTSLVVLQLMAIFSSLLLQIPITMLHVIISERQENRDTAVADVTSKWGHDQALMAPVLVVPYREEVKEYSVAVDGKAVRKDKPEYVTRYAVFLPDALDVSAEIESQPLYRGIYEQTSCWPSRHQKCYQCRECQRF